MAPSIPKILLIEDIICYLLGSSVSAVPEQTFLAPSVVTQIESIDCCFLSQDGTAVMPLLTLSTTQYLDPRVQTRSWALHVGYFALRNTHANHINSTTRWRVYSYCWAVDVRSVTSLEKVIWNVAKKFLSHVAAARTCLPFQLANTVRQINSHKISVET